MFFEKHRGAIRSSTKGRRKPDKVPFHPMDILFSSVPFRVRKALPDGPAARSVSGGGEYRKPARRGGPMLQSAATGECPRAHARTLL